MNERFRWSTAYLGGLRYAADDGGGGGDAGDGDTEATGDKGGDKAGDKGGKEGGDPEDIAGLKAALEAERAINEKNSKHITKLRKTNKELRTGKPAPTTKPAPKDGDKSEVDLEAERQAARDEALTSANVKVLAAEIKSQASGKLSNPQLAVRLLLDDLKEDVDGDPDYEPDEGAIKKAIDKLLRETPGLAAEGKSKAKTKTGSDFSSGSGDSGKVGINDAIRALARK